MGNRLSNVKSAPATAPATAPAPASDSKMSGRIGLTLEEDANADATIADDATVDATIADDATVDDATADDTTVDDATADDTTVNTDKCKNKPISWPYWIGMNLGQLRFADQYYNKGEGDLQWWLDAILLVKIRECGCRRCHNRNIATAGVE